jgi:glyoxylase-like metal-dependent hydrolase (beta-lactamase superfamily II)
MAMVRDPSADRLVSQLRLLRLAGAEELATQMAGSDDGIPADLWEDPDDWLRAWAVVPGLGRRLTAVPTPGHTRGHLVFHDPTAELLFAGDHVLPAITPSIGLEPDVARRPLADYLRSLLLMKDLPDCTLLPAHGPVSPSVHARVDELLEHHARRLEAAYLAVGPSGTAAAEVAGRLRWTRHGRSLTELSPFDAMLAVLEAAAHLDVLADRGRLDVSQDGAVRRYSRR